MPSIEVCFFETKKALKEAGIAEYEAETGVIFEHLGIGRMKRLLDGKEELSEELYEKLSLMVEKRRTGYPLAYITGIKNFAGFDFKVDENVLIPRFDTENLVEEIRRYCKGKRVLDLCTGSGCIIIALSLLGDIASGVGTDLSPKALEIARENAKRLHADNVKFFCGDLFDALVNVNEQVDQKQDALQEERSSAENERFDIIVSNPPYIRTQVIETLEKQVREYEPRMALDGDGDGLKFYRKICRGAKRWLTPSGILAFEIGFDQADEVSALMKENGFSGIRLIKDLNGLDRVLVGFADLEEKDHV